MKNITGIIALLSVLLTSTAAFAGDDIYVEYVRNYDGDTVTVDLVDLRDIDLDGTYKTLWDNISIRVRGIDTPEIRTRCKSEKALGYQAKYIVQNILKDAKEVIIKNISRGKYFRLVADVYADGVNITDALFEAELAVVYNGRKKTYNWCK